MPTGAQLARGRVAAVEFFIPYIDDAKKAEEVWRAIERFLAETQGYDGITDSRIFRLEYTHNGKEWEAQVGEPHPYGQPATWEYVPDYSDPKAGEYVVAILEMQGGPFLVCTHSRGVVRGEPILVGGVHKVVYFDDYAPLEGPTRTKE